MASETMHTRRRLTILDFEMYHWPHHDKVSLHMEVLFSSIGPKNIPIISEYHQRLQSRLENPFCSSEDEEEYLSFDEEYDETDYVFAEIESSSEDDEAEDDDIQITVTTTRSVTVFEEGSCHFM